MDSLALGETFNICLLGNEGVGKTTLIQKLCGKNMDLIHYGDEVSAFESTLLEKSVHFWNFFDVKDASSFSVLKHSSVVLLCYDITSVASYNAALSKWASKCTEAFDAKIILTGCKSDLESTRSVDSNTVKSKAEAEGYDLIDVSSVKGTSNLQELTQMIIHDDSNDQEIENHSSVKTNAPTLQSLLEEDEDVNTFEEISDSRCSSNTMLEEPPSEYEEHHHRRSGKANHGSLELLCNMVQHEVIDAEVTRPAGHADIWLFKPKSSSKSGSNTHKVGNKNYLKQTLSSKKKTGEEEEKPSVEALPMNCPPPQSPGKTSLHRRGTLNSINRSAHRSVEVEMKLQRLERENSMHSEAFSPSKSRVVKINMESKPNLLYRVRQNDTTSAAITAVQDIIKNEAVSRKPEEIAELIKVLAEKLEGVPSNEIAGTSTSSSPTKVRKKNYRVSKTGELHRERVMASLNIETNKGRNINVSLTKQDSVPVVVDKFISKYPRYSHGAFADVLNRRLSSMILQHEATDEKQTSTIQLHGIPTI